MLIFANCVIHRPLVCTDVLFFEYMVMTPTDAARVTINSKMLSAIIMVPIYVYLLWVRTIVQVPF